ncbi:IS66 family transposase, partial [Desulfobulbus alkaliphilus]|uniref:IS66 family transposase n=1 Tax=Desulfobulbus alkaliphilus TaxID=869814 RepID=UPI0019634521
MTLERIEINGEEAQKLLDRVKSSVSDEDYRIIKGLIDTHLLLNQAVNEKSISIKRLLQMIFGVKTEKSRSGSNSSDRKKSDNGEKKARGHGRNGAEAYSGAEEVSINHQALSHCDPCPACPDGRLYRQPSPGVVVRIKGTAPLWATVYELEKLRCNICGTVFTADLPSGAGTQKYDETAAAMLAILRYGSGLPLNRLAGLQAALGVPLAASTAWEETEKLADRIHPAFGELIFQAAQGEIFHNDDTTAKILDLMAENRNASPELSRTGIFTTGILSILDGRKIAIFCTGRKHAGENLATLLGKRQDGLDPPIQMCDALSRNTSEAFQKVLAHCLTHGRRNFVDVAEHFPEQCQYVLDTLGTVYQHDAIAAREGMTSAQRLHYHQVNSGPLMENLHHWLGQQFAEKKVEPNSSLGKAIKYMLKHWPALTLFLRVEKAPLDNNICEQALKMAIMHRKNSLFYKTEHGAYIGDMFMSLIHTCFLCKVNPFEYLTALQKNSADLFAHPHRWLPWNYKE